MSSTDKNKEPIYKDKNTGEVVHLDPTYLSAVNIYANCEWEGKVNEDEHKNFFSATPYNVIASDVPKFNEPICKDHNKKQFKYKYAKALFLLDSVKYNMHWKSSTIYQITSDISLREEEEKVEDKNNNKVSTSNMTLIEDAACYMRLSTHNSKMLMLFKNAKDISRTVKDLIDIGCLSVKDNTYIKGKKSKEYLFFKNNIKKFKDWCEENNIPKLKVPTQLQQYEEYLEEENENVNNFADIIRDKVNIGDVKIYKMNEDKKLTEMVVLNIIYDKYPQIRELQETYELLYDNFYGRDEENNISPLAPQSQITLTWNENNTYIKKIGFRETNKFCSVPKVSKDNKRCRQDVLEEYNLTAYKFDVRSSVPRLTYYKNTGIWMPMDTDIYKLIFDKFVEMSGHNYEWTHSMRELVKKAVLANGFDKENMTGVHICNKLNLRSGEVWEKISEEAKLFHQAIEQTVGPITSEIFVDESVIYGTITRSFLYNGFKAWQIYDEWHLDNMPQENKDSSDSYMEELIEERVKEYYKSYYNITSQDSLNKEEDIREEKIYNNNKVSTKENELGEEEYKEEGEEDEISEEDIKAITEQYKDLKSEEPVVQEEKVVNKDDLENKSVQELLNIKECLLNKSFLYLDNDTAYNKICEEIELIKNLIKNKQENL